MNKKSTIDLIKESIYCDTIVRDKELYDSPTKAYYDDLLQALSIEDFPIIEINTINKRTYTFESISDKRYYLVFDHYFLDCIHEIDQIIWGKYDFLFLNSFIYKMLAEECYSNRKYALSIQFAGQYLITIDEVIKEYNEKSSDESIPNALFIQQAFLIAHELFHYVLNRDPSLLSTGIRKKREFLKSLQMKPIQGLLKKHTDDLHFLEECLCDATGLIQAIDIARSLGKMNAAEAASVSAMAIMGQTTVTTIQEAVKKSPDISFELIMEKSTARLMHFMAFAPQYIEDSFSVDESRMFMQKAHSMYTVWLFNTQLPVVGKLNTYKKDFQENPVRDSLSIKELGKAKDTLIQVFCI